MPRGVKKTTEQAEAVARQDQGLTKMEAMRRSLAELGADAKPLQLQEHLKSKFGIDMDTSVISTYKGNLKKKAGKRGPGRPKGVKSAAAPVISNGRIAGASSNGRTAEAISLDDIHAVKALVNKIGSDNVRALVDVLGK